MSLVYLLALIVSQVLFTTAPISLFYFKNLSEMGKNLTPLDTRLILRGHSLQVIVIKGE